MGAVFVQSLRSTTDMSISARDLASPGNESLRIFPICLVQLRELCQGILREIPLSLEQPRLDLGPSAL